jgi:hypothetical protein
MAEKQEVAFDERAVGELEIEPDESSAQESEKEPDKSTEWEGEYGEAGCPISMGEYHGDVRCGREIHVAPDGVDEKPVCLMHSKDPQKQSGPLFDAFCSEFERVLGDAGQYLARFQRFVFPHLDLAGRYIEAICLFVKATFTQDADFRKVTFTENAYFAGAIFTQDANFSDAAFTLNADFAGAIFTQNANFSSATFRQDARFCHATFMQSADCCTATFMQNADFSYATFREDAGFILATFTQDADFHIATFTQNANFYSATFSQTANFMCTNFHGMAVWRGSRFLDRAEFRRTKFEPLVEGEPSAVFELANFSKPDEVVFDHVDLSRALFHNCDVSQVWFTSSVRWGKRESSRSLAVFEETIDLKHRFGRGLRRDGQRDFRAVAQIYQQLKKNYDSRLDYWTANEIHFGEMEMKRLAGATDGPFLWLRRWFHRKLSLVALYRHASDYGNSYVKPTLWLLGILVLFAALLPLPGVGLKQQGARQTETYASVWRTGDGWTTNLWAEARLAGKSAITSVDAATLQKSAEYAPAYPCGRILATFETLLTSTLFALFLLAIRRQFRR